MSLDLQHLAPTGPSLGIGYHSFGEYRRLLARDAAGIDLDTMIGFGGRGAWPPDDIQPLAPLLKHSDCDGWLYQGECAHLRPVLAAFRPSEAWPLWARDYHGQLTGLVARCADEGGVIRFH